MNTWWDTDPNQRYWVEITDRLDVGGHLQSPNLGGSPSTPGYDLVSLIEPGDVVLHYDARQMTFVGWSTVAAVAYSVPSYKWTPRNEKEERDTEGWVGPLSAFTPFAQQVTTEDLQARKDALLDLLADLAVRHGKPVYFPVYLYGLENQQQIRMQQAYFYKWPLELFEVLPELRAAMGTIPQSNADENEVPEDNRPPKSKVARGKVARAQDPALRAALERRSLDIAKDYYRSSGATDDDIRELGKPFDLVVTVGGIERHVEVKGSSQDIATVELTRNEVKHSGPCPACDLIVVDNIEWSRVGEEVITSGGRLRVWTDWKPDPASLAPTKYAYDLPTDHG